MCYILLYNSLLHKLRVPNGPNGFMDPTKLELWMKPSRSHRPSSPTSGRKKIWSPFWPHFVNWIIFSSTYDKQYNIAFKFILFYFIFQRKGWANFKMYI